MRGFFNYPASLSIHETDPVEFRILFKALGSIVEGDFAEEIKIGVQQILYPDVILVICSEEEFLAVKDVLNKDTLQVAIRRLSTRTSLYVCGFDNGGAFKKWEAIKENGHKAKTLVRSRWMDLIQTGIETLLTVKGVIVPAPPGYAFVKPSGERSTHFIRTEEALADSENVAFLAFALLPRIKRRIAQGRTLSVIYVDTMAIASVAYALRELLRSSSFPTPQVASFHSHDGLGEIEAPIPGTSFCIISASSSLSLERRWKMVTSCYEDEVVTLLTFDTATDFKKALLAIKEPTGWKRLGPDDGTLRSLRIIGERFHPEQISAKQVVIGIDHRVPNFEGIAEDLCDANVFRVLGRGSAPTAPLRPIYVDGDALVVSAKFLDWVKSKLRDEVPASIQGIIFQSDSASEKLANVCAAYYADMGHPLPLGCVNADKLSLDGLALNKHRALLVVGAVVGRGTQMLSISRDLRLLHNGSKTYLIGLQISELHAHGNFLEKNLKQTKERTNRHFKYATIATGSGIVGAYKAEAELAKSSNDAGANFLRSRLQFVEGSATGVSEPTFLPRGDARLRYLELRPDFLYWTEKYQAGSQHAPLVLATIANMLQRAREERFQKDALRLASDTFQQVILDPQVFARFNDGIVQAAILRAAYPSELDYSSSRDTSRHMSAIIRKMITQRSKQQGEAVLELALALKTERMRLCSDHHQELYASTKSILIGKAWPIPLLKFLIRPPDTNEQKLILDDQDF
jgi:hypothetical protein